MARSRRGGKAAAKPKNDPKNEPKSKPKSEESSEESEKESGTVDETFVVAGHNGLKEKNSVAPKVLVENCDSAVLVKHKTNEQEDSFIEPENEDEEFGATAADGGGGGDDKDLSGEESSPDKMAVDDSGSDSEESNHQSASADESDPNESVEDEEELPAPLPRSKTNANLVKQPEATKNLKRGAKKDTSNGEPVAECLTFAPGKATGTSRNPGKVSSVAEKKKLGTAVAKIASKKTEAEPKAGSSKAKEGRNSKVASQKPISGAKKDMMIDLLVEGLTKHEEKKGVSMPTIKKYVLEHDVKERNWSQLQLRVKKALEKALTEGKILRPKGNEHIKGMVGRFKVNKNYGTKKVGQRGAADSSEVESSIKKGVVTKSSAKPKKRTADQEEEIQPKEIKGQASKVPKKRPEVFSSSDTDDDFEKPISLKAPPAAVKGSRRKSKSGGELGKTKGPPKPKTMKRSHSVEIASTSTNARKGRPKSKK